MILYFLDAGIPGLHDHVAGAEQQLLEPLPLLAAKQQLPAHQQRTLLFQGTFNVLKPSGCNEIINCMFLYREWSAY